MYMYSLEYVFLHYAVFKFFLLKFIGFKFNWYDQYYNILTMMSIDIHKYIRVFLSEILKQYHNCKYAQVFR